MITAKRCPTEAISSPENLVHVIGQEKNGELTTLPLDPIPRQVEAPEAQGWLRRFMVEAGRADECIELYESLGHDVRMRPVRADSLVDEECATCLLAASHRYVVIYTRLMDE